MKLPEFFLFHDPEANHHNYQADHDYRRIAIFPRQLRHIGKVHPIPASHQGQGQKNSSDDGEVIGMNKVYVDVVTEFRKDGCLVPLFFVCGC